MSFHFHTKFDKKAIHCIFVGYNNQRKGWRYCDPNTGKCYIIKNVMFDEASSKWNSQKEELSVSKEIKVKEMREQSSENCQVSKLKRSKEKGKLNPLRILGNLVFIKKYKVR